MAFCDQLLRCRSVWHGASSIAPARGKKLIYLIHGEDDVSVEETVAAMKADASGILDYRKAREAALRRRSSRAS